jgi:hypothetical protein
MIVVGTTLSAMAMSDDDAWRGWLYNAEALVEQTEEEVTFFVAIETDGRGVEPFRPLLDRLKEIDGHYWTFSLDDGRERVTFSNRLRHITAGQNLVTDYAMSLGASHLLFMASDCAYPANALTELLKLNVPVVGGHVPTYCLDGPVVSKFVPAYRDQIRAHMPTAAFVLLSREFFRFHRWRWDIDAGMSDDPCLYHDAIEFYGIQPVVHHGVVGQHYPECIGDYESRGYDTSVVR